MEWNDFVENLKDALEIPEEVELQKDDSLHDSEYWSSMHALLIMALAEAEYDVSVTGKELRETKSIGALYTLIASKQE